MSVVCRECRWQGTIGPGEDRCPICRTPFGPANTGRAILRPPSTPEPPRAALAGAGAGKPAVAPPQAEPRRTGSFMLGLGMAGLTAAGLAVLYAPGLLSFRAATAETGAVPVVADTTAAPPPSTLPEPGPHAARGMPPPELVARELQAYLPAGYAAAGAPELTDEPTADGRYVYRVPLQARRTVYRVPVVPVRLGAGAPAVLRENRTRLVLHRALPPGREYDVAAAQAAPRQGDRVQGTWRVRLADDGGAWRVVDRGPVTVAAPSAATGSSGLLTEAELEAVQSERRAALDRYTARVQAVEREVEAMRTAALRDVPRRCPRDVAALLGEVVRLASDCPSVADPAQRSTCFQRRDRTNQELGACERQNQLHDERAEAVRRAVAVRRGERLAWLARELAREARLHGQTAGN